MVYIDDVLTEAEILEAINWITTHCWNCFDPVLQVKKAEDGDQEALKQMYRQKVTGVCEWLPAEERDIAEEVDLPEDPIRRPQDGEIWVLNRLESDKGRRKVTQVFYVDFKALEGKRVSETQFPLLCFAFIEEECAALAVQENRVPLHLRRGVDDLFVKAGKPSPFGTAGMAKEDEGTTSKPRGCEEHSSRADNCFLAAAFDEPFPGTAAGWAWYAWLLGPERQGYLCPDCQRLTVERLLTQEGRSQVTRGIYYPEKEVREYIFPEPDFFGNRYPSPVLFVVFEDCTSYMHAVEREHIPPNIRADVARLFKTLGTSEFIPFEGDLVVEQSTEANRDSINGNGENSLGTEAGGMDDWRVKAETALRSLMDDPSYDYYLSSPLRYEVLVYFLSRGLELSERIQNVRDEWLEWHEIHEASAHYGEDEGFALWHVLYNGLGELMDHCSMLRMAEWGKIGGFQDDLGQVVRSVQSRFIYRQNELWERPVGYELYQIVRCEQLRQKNWKGILELIGHLYDRQCSDGYCEWHVTVDPEVVSFRDLPDTAIWEPLCGDVSATASLVFATVTMDLKEKWWEQASRAADWLLRVQHSDGHFVSEIEIPRSKRDLEPVKSYFRLFYEPKGQIRPDLEVTCVALMALSLLKPQGWEPAVARGREWLLHQQREDGCWRALEVDPAWLTVLVLDAIDLADGKYDVTFKIPEHLRGDSQASEAGIKPGKSEGDGAQKITEDRKVIARFPTPEGTRWDEVTIAFVSNDSVKITARDASETFLYSDIGFRDGRKKNMFDSRWKLLQTYAEHPEGIFFGTKLDQKTRHSLKPGTSDLRKRLKAIMGMDDDPFELYRKVKAYKPKFTIIDNEPGTAR